MQKEKQRKRNTKPRCSVTFAKRTIHDLVITHIKVLQIVNERHPTFNEASISTSLHTYMYLYVLCTSSIERFVQ